VKQKRVDKEKRGRALLPEEPEEKKKITSGTMFCYLCKKGLPAIRNALGKYRGSGTIFSFFKKRHSRRLSVKQSEFTQHERGEGGVKRACSQV